MPRLTELVGKPAQQNSRAEGVNWNATNPEFRQADALGLAGYSAEQARHFDELFAIFHPLVPPSEAGFLLSASDSAVADLASEGRLRAVDISSAGEHAGRTEPRIYLYSIAHVLLRPRLPLQLLPPEAIFPHRRAAFMRREVADLLSCTEKHVGKIAELKQAKLSERLSNIPRHVLADFLTAREIVPSSTRRSHQSAHTGGHATR